MTADEREKIGRLIGTAEAQERRLGKIEACLTKLDEKLDTMQLHVAPVAAQIAKELASYRVEEAKWKVEVIGPLVDGVSSLENSQIAVSSAEKALSALKLSQRSTKRWLIGISATVVGTICAVIINAFRIYYS